MCQFVDIHGLGAVASAVECLGDDFATVHVNHGYPHLAADAAHTDGGGAAGRVRVDGAGGSRHVVDADRGGGEAGAHIGAVLSVTAGGAHLGDVGRAGSEAGELVLVLGGAGLADGGAGGVGQYDLPFIAGVAGRPGEERGALGDVGGGEVGDPEPRW